ncbi:MAG: galactose-1-phosphate uridylyltransferase [Microbacteriaceae bacterium]|jgi:UDPglucose--hexose-1-phosphate uridylyltransferase|nr:galactose-1-phosphate uridylyltransferase [Microbacteriaceae bacterium]
MTCLDVRHTQAAGRTVTRTKGVLADGREILFYDTDPAYATGERIRSIDDHRPLGQREDPPAASANIRVDPLTGNSVVIAAHRQNRTYKPPADQDPLAPTTGDSLTEVPEPDYEVVVFENRFPSLQGGLSVYRDEPLRHETSPAGRCEVVCFSSDSHGSFSQLGHRRTRTVIEAWADRTAELSARDEVQQVFIFENRGEEIGVTLPHPHGQIYAYSYLPAYTREVLSRAEAWEGDLLGDVLRAELDDGVRVVAENEHWVAFVPYAAKWPVEVQIMPRRAVPDFAHLSEEEREELADLYPDILGRFDAFFGLPLPYIAAWHQVPRGCGDRLSRMWLDLFSLRRSPDKMKFLAGSESGVAAWISDTTPERIASRLREAEQERS